MASIVVAVLLVILSLFYVLQYLQLRRDLIERLGLSSVPLSDVIKKSLKHAMQSRDMENIHLIVKNISEQEGVRKVLIINKKGEIKVSPDNSEIGKILEVSDYTCQICHKNAPENRSKTVIFSESNGERVYRNVNPIANEPQCYGCHDPKDQLNGVLISDFSMAGVERHLSAKLKQMILSLLITVFLTVLTICSLLNQVVIKKLERFVKATRLLSKGNLDQQVEIEGNDEIGELALSFNQMVENLKKSKELRERKELLENVLNSVSDAIIIYGPEEQIISFNREAEEMFGYRPEEVLAKRHTTLGPEREKGFSIVRRQGIYQEEVRLKAKTGQKFSAYLNLRALKDERDKLIGFVEITHDLAEEKARESLQQQLIHSEKFAATGKLAAGVAHELNNPLGNILLYAKLLLEDLSPAEQSLSRNAKHIVDNTMRCKGIVNDLLDYARESGLEMTSISLNEIAQKAVRMLNNEMKINNIECTLSLQDNLPLLHCDQNQIQQVLINLIQNAIEAVGNHGHITIFTRQSGGDGEILFGVRDDGPGIPTDNLSKIYEPFFTTKEKGTGLGLSISYRIVERHQGRIWAEHNLPSPLHSSNRAGVTFYVQLPLHSSDTLMKEIVSVEG